MSSPAYSLEKNKDQDVPLTLRKRLFLFFLVCCIQMTYIPTSNRIEGGIEPKLAIDLFPVSAIWVVPYVLCYLLWIGSFVWILFKVKDRDYRAFIAACMLTFGLGALTFIFFPTYVQPAVLEGNDVFTNLLRTIHETWGRYDAFPSGHVYITTLLALFFSRWYPRHKPVWFAIVIVVSLSTLFTAQHYILDVIGGYIAALAGYYFGVWWAGLSRTQKQTSKRPDKRIASSY